MSSSMLTLHNEEHVTVVLDGLGGRIDETFIPRRPPASPICRPSAVTTSAGSLIIERAVSEGGLGDGDQFPLA
jgi:hypothetical protein